MLNGQPNFILVVLILYNILLYHLKYWKCLITADYNGHQKYRNKKTNNKVSLRESSKQIQPTFQKGEESTNNLKSLVKVT